MYFKNLILYRLTEGWNISAEELSQKLADFTFQPCGSLDPMRYGFVPPLGDHGTDLVHAANGYIMICARKQEKILPSSVINEKLAEKVKAVRAAESRSVGRKEAQSFKDEIIFSLMPHAFTSSTLDYAYIAPQDNLIVVNASSAKRAEDLLSKLREAMGSLRCVPLTAKGSPTQMMTHWMQTDEMPPKFELGEECELHAGKDGRVVRFKKQDLTADEPRSHLLSGMYVTKISLTWRESIHFIVDDQLTVKALRFDDVITEKANERNPESKAEQFDADFAVMTFELKHFIDALLAAFGGESTFDVAEATPALGQPAAPASKPAVIDFPCSGKDDPLYPDAVILVRKENRVSISMVQRHLRVGYNRAARLVEEMEADGVVSHCAHDGSRTVL